MLLLICSNLSLYNTTIKETQYKKIEKFKFRYTCEFLIETVIQFLVLTVQITKYYENSKLEKIKVKNILHKYST